ncbi:MAG TPA: glycosyltransferase, partial [Myxococcota bacterium]|nr:glycosyltransferase [Myxococcota bacterium]
MRILHLVSYSLYSGPVPSTVGLAMAQRALGHTVWLAYDTKRGNFNDFEEAAAPRLRGAQLAPPLPLSLSAKSSPRELWRDWRTLRGFLGANGADVVHTHLSHDHALVALAGASGVRRVRTFHASRSLAPRRGQTWLNRCGDGWIVRCGRHRDTLLHAFDAREDRVAVIPGSIDAAAWRLAGDVVEVRGRLRAAWGVPDDVPLLGHVALIAGRGQEELVYAVHRLGALAPHVVFVGRGERETGLRALVRRLGVDAKVAFAGYLQGPALVEAYAAVDA